MALSCYATSAWRSYTTNGECNCSGHMKGTGQLKGALLLRHLRLAILQHGGNVRMM